MTVLALDLGNVLPKVTGMTTAWVIGCLTYGHDGGELVDRAGTAFEVVRVMGREQSASMVLTDGIPEGIQCKTGCE